jgi:hypothetical protein
MKKNKISENIQIPITMTYKELESGQGHADAVKLSQKGYKIIAVKDNTNGQNSAMGNSDVSGGQSYSQSTSTSMGGMYEESDMPIDGDGQGQEVDAVIEPQDAETIKYLSNVKDTKTGEVSKPFVIADKRYQMVRGMKPNKEVVLAVFCFDDMGPDGANMIHHVDEFEKKVAGPMLEMEKGQQGGDPYDQGVDYSDLGDYKHFFVHKDDGSLKAKFKTIKEMMMSGIALGENEQYLNLRELKKNRINRFMECDTNLYETDIPKLKTDVQKLVDLIKTRFSAAFAKLDKPIEQVQFLDTLGQEFGLTKDKINKLTTSLKSGNVEANADVEKPQAKNLGVNPTPVAEKKIITKKQFSESIKKEIKK